MSKLIDITGQTFDSWTVIRYVGKQKWLCRCKCGEEAEVRGVDLGKGKSTQCFDCSYKARGEKLKLDITGQTFGSWTVIRYVGEQKWLCRCKCGKENEIKGGDLRSGKSKQCLECGRKAGGEKLKLDITGQTFGSWTVISPGGVDHKGYSMSLCKCKCGKIMRVLNNSLNSGKSTQCVECGNKVVSEKTSSHNHYRYNPDREQVRRNKRIRNFMQQCIKRCLFNKNGRHTHELLGYTKEDLIDHIESKWTEGMSWENYGYRGWHIDHIKPIDAFIQEGIEDPAIINALRNLQPLWAKDNLKKNCKNDGGA